MRRRILAIGVLLAVLVCGVAYAASGPNVYTATFTAGANGTKAKPVPVGVTEKLSMKSATKGDRGGYPLTSIDSTVSGLEAPYAKDFPTCTITEIENAGNSGGWNKVCASKSLVASGTVDAVVGTKGNLASAGAPCDLDLDVYNAGPGKLTYFFVVPTTGVGCDGLQTGTAASPWLGYVKQSGSSLVNDVPEPADVSTDAGNIGLWGSLETETLNWKKLTTKVKGKTVGFLESIGCKASKRSAKTTFTATTTGTNHVSQTVTSSTKC